MDAQAIEDMLAIAVAAGAEGLLDDAEAAFRGASIDCVERLCQRQPIVDARALNAKAKLNRPFVSAEADKIGVVELFLVARAERNPVDVHTILAQRLYCESLVPCADRSNHRVTPGDGFVPKQQPLFLSVTAVRRREPAEHQTLRMHRPLPPHRKPQAAAGGRRTRWP